MNDFDEKKIRYLEIIESIISRMASNCFILKGWMITLVAGIFVITFEKGNLLVVLVFIPIITFCLLDTYYLQLERRYRKLYEQTLEIVPNNITFTLKAPAKSKEDKTLYRDCLISPTELGFYLPILAVAIIITKVLLFS